MNIQKISLPQIVSFSGKDDDKKNIKKEPQTLKQPEASAQDALDSMGRAQIINMPQRPKKLKTIEEKCDHFIDKYQKEIEAVQHGASVPLSTPEEFIKSRENVINRLTILKSLDERYSKKLGKRELMAIGFDHNDTDTLKRNIEIMNGLDDKFLPKIRPFAMPYFLKFPRLQESFDRLGKMNDVLFEHLSTSAFTDAVLETDVCTESESTIKKFMILQQAIDCGQITDKQLDDWFSGKIFLDVDLPKAEIVDMKKPD